MKILVVGSWNPEKSREYINQANELGYELAQRGHILIASPSSGFQALVAKAYKQNNGSEFVGYFPKLKLMKEVGEKVLIQPDTSILTNKDYPIRNLLQIKGSDAVIGITGGLGTLTELIASIKDYNLPTSFYEGSSPVIDSVIKVEKDFAKNLKCGNNICELLDYLEIMGAK